jgi:hypothetical protein
MNSNQRHSSKMMIDSEQAVFDIVAAEVSKLTNDELVASLQHNTLDTPKMGAMVPGSGCRFCLPQHDDLGRETESGFECDLKACVIHSLVSHTLGILQDADLMFNRANIATARSRLTSVLQTIFSEQKSKEIAARLIKILDTTERAFVNDGWAD